MSEAESYIDSLELMGMRFGLERMRALLERLGHPEAEFDAIHVVGSNGKSSTVRFCEALLEADGVTTGAYLSPHLTTFRERIRVGGATVGEQAYERAVLRVAAAAPAEGVTQFEALTAAAFVIFAEHGVEWAVVEAGLGGRLDATNVLPRSRVQVLTNVALEHTELLGDSRPKIAAEKLAVVPEGGVVIFGEEGWEELVPQAARTLEVSVGGSFQEQNRAVARAAVEAALGRPVDPKPMRAAGDPRPSAGARQPAARDLGRGPQPGRNAAAGRRSCPPCSATALRSPCSRRCRTRTWRRCCRCCARSARRWSRPARPIARSMPAEEIVRHDRRRIGRRSAPGAGGGADAGRAARRGGRVRLAVPAARPR